MAAKRLLLSNAVIGDGMEEDRRIERSPKEPAVSLVARFGNDAHGKMLSEIMAENGVSLEFSTHWDGPSGQAIIMLAKNGQNSIILIGGANMSWEDVDLPLSLSLGIQAASLILLQREVPDFLNKRVMETAKCANVPVIFDCGGDSSIIPGNLLQLATIISPNETELERIVNRPLTNEIEMVEAIRVLQQDFHLGAFLVKRGEFGALFVPPVGDVVMEPAVHVPSEKILDTTGAGDTFTAAFGVAWVEGKSIGEAMRFGCKAASLCIQAKGAIPSLPFRVQVDQL